jgi:hypothetical protein
MAAKERANWHLTPAGWVLGTVSHDFGTNERTIPKDRVLTALYTQTAAGFDRPLVDDTHQEWRSDDSDAVKGLLA